MANRQTFDIIYGPSTAIGWAQQVYVMARDVEAIDRTHALLTWFRTEIGLKIDPAEMYGGEIEYKAECGCEFGLEFGARKLGRIERLRTGETAVPIAMLDCEPCEEHQREDIMAPEQRHREWDGTFAAWVHDPKRPDTFER